MPYRRKKLTFAISSPDEFLSTLSFWRPVMSECRGPIYPKFLTQVNIMINPIFFSRSRKDVAMATDNWRESAKIDVLHFHPVHRHSTTDGRISTSWMSALTPPMTPHNKVPLKPCLIKLGELWSSNPWVLQAHFSRAGSRWALPRIQFFLVL